MEGGHHRHHELLFRRKFFISTLLTLPVLVFSPFVQELIGFTAPAVPYAGWITPVLSVVIFAYGGLPFLRMARGELTDRQPGMMTLISLAIGVAFVYSIASLFIEGASSFFWELVTLIDIMLLGHWIEMRSVRQASGALDALAELMPDTAERITDEETGDTEEVPVDELEEGDLVLVRPGSSVPADGVVREGESHVNEAMITGESEPVGKEPGDQVIGGTVNQDGSLRVEVTATGEGTTLSGIMELVREAEESKSETQRLADRAAGWLFYIALGAAAVTATAWTLAAGFGLPVLERTVTVLVIACPHALGLAIPLVVAINTSLAAQNGILIRDQTALERARELDVVVFDKTGTLTEGEQSVVDLATDGMDEDEALRLMAAVESDSEHIIAQAVRQEAEDRGIDRPGADGFTNIRGKGVQATVEGEQLLVGGPNLLEDEGLSVPDALERFTEEHGSAGHTVVYLVRDGAPVAAVALADAVRPESHAAVQALHDRGIEVAMMTGDSQGVADAVAEELGIDTVFAEVLPDEKDGYIQQLQEDGSTVAMVGDGVNDAPALTRADIGIAIGSGTDVAVESADIVLVKSDPLDIDRLLTLSVASDSKMRQNLVWAAGYNVLAIPLAAGVLAPWGFVLPPAIGALVMSMSTVIVAVNAQLLRRVQL